MEHDRMLAPFRTWFMGEVNRLDREMLENVVNVQAAVYGQPRVTNTRTRKRGV